MDLRLLYRGPLSSCNFGCTYCPFAKRVESREELALDEAALARFLSHIILSNQHRFGILFTPWGEALIRPWYQQALVSLARAPHIERVAIQTNLSGRIDFVDAIDRADRSRVALWATFHPEWVERRKFVDKVSALVEAGVRVSCGAVGFVRLADEIEALREELPSSVYLWVNAVKRDETYRPEDIARFVAIDPLFQDNVTAHASLGRTCRAGASVLTVDGEGALRRCHFVPTVIGNLYHPGIEAALAERACPNETCGCHIGYVHLDHLGLDRVYGDGILERIPTSPVWIPLRRSAASTSTS